MTENRAFSDIKELCRKLCEIPSVSGYEELCTEEIKKTVLGYTDFFGEFEKLSCAGLLFTRRCGKKDAPKLLIDAHLDTVGFAVTEILEGGFLRVCPIGGVDKRLLFASEVTIHAKEDIPGFFISTPPHLSKADDGKLPDISEILIDTGYSDESLRELVEIGDSVSYKPRFCELMGDMISAPFMDDKICAVAVLLAAKLLEEKADALDCDVIFSFSSAEEINGSGAEPLGKLMCDGAVVLDVNFGRDKGIEEKESYVLGKGCGVSYSATTSRYMTDALVRCADKADIPLNRLVETSNTGTNAHFLSNAYLGTPCAVLSIPEKYMHSAVETVDMKDVFACAKLLCEFALGFSKTAGEMKAARKVLPKKGGDEK